MPVNYIVIFRSVTDKFKEEPYPFYKLFKCTMKILSFFQSETLVLLLVVCVGSFSNSLCI